MVIATHVPLSPCALARELALNLGVGDDLFKVIHRHGALVALGALADRDGALLRLFVAHYQHVGHLLLLSLGDLGAHGLGVAVYLDAAAYRAQLLGDVLGIV